MTEPQWAAALIALAEAALGQLAPDEFALQARLHAQIGQLLHLTTAPDREQREAEETARAVDSGERSGDPQALQAALRAHQFANTHPQGVEARVRAGQRMIRLGHDFDDPWPQLWGRLWCADAFVQLGRLAEAEVELDELEPVVARLRWPTARWHVLRSRAAILQARGEFDAALDSAERAGAEISGSGLGRAVLTQSMFLERQSDLVGEVPGGEERRRRILEWAAVEQAALPRLITSLLREGNKDSARSLYARQPPPDRWDPARYMLALQLTDRLRAAIALNLRDDVGQVAARLQPLAVWHVSMGSGTVLTLGSGFLYTGMAAGFLGDLDRAIADMTNALHANARSGALHSQLSPGKSLRRCWLVVGLASTSTRRAVSHPPFWPKRGDSGCIRSSRVRRHCSVACRVGA